ncbi:hypothetical protein AFM11_33915 [Mycolicibacterium wolinskyi]|uniref:Cation-transporting P-type ATPase N-terminal domain-containing protein n=1 Tax=Mycolicibacterium wolinskyi TaxID=59750 RepID=A0A132PBP5_9MYCO|nr:cation-transporting P-type ATPase [Mycolicibacterium wolinskyi]KWX19753.1 hypothetical protein AFM11_33915 [Mycolicibacterium wolinskyi]
MAEITASAEDALGSALAHSRSVTEVLEVLGSSGDGLDSDSARDRLATYGPNKLPEKRPRPALLRFFAHFNNVLIYILIAAGVLKAILNEWVDCAVIISVAVINAAVGFLQEGRAQRALDSIRGMLSVTAQVRRDGHWRQVDAQTLVAWHAASLQRVKKRCGGSCLMAVPPRAGGPSLVPVQVDEDSAEQERQLLGEFGLAHSPLPRRNRDD